ncbi:MAG: GNAT family N-acetyltransferase [Bacteroidetes bacterium]|nr:GNAT family N-acetyltransferase [Bacteroidota bacterium]
MMESANYRLVKTSIEDKKAISDLLGMPEFLMRFEEDPIKVNIELYFDNLLNINNFCFSIFCKKENKCIGFLLLQNYIFDEKRIEFGICIHPDYWGKSVLSEVFPVLLSFVKTNLAPIEIFAIIEENNSIAQKAALKLGFDLCTKTAKNEPNDLFYYHIFSIKVSE